VSLITIAEVRAVVSSALDDPTLQTIIDSEEAEFVHRFGAIADGTTARTETLKPYNHTLVFCSRPIASISSVQERLAITSDLSTVGATAYRVRPNRGQLIRAIGIWGWEVAVTYVAVDERDRVKRALIELVRLALSQTAMQAENIAGEYSYSAPENWQIVRSRIYQRAGWMRI
jgi:hypothetical protein